MENTLNKYEQRIGSLSSNLDLDVVLWATVVTSCFKSNS